MNARSFRRFGSTGRTLLLVSLLTPISPWACGRAPVAPGAANGARTDAAGQTLFGLRAPMTHNGISYGILRADSALVFDDGMRLELHGVTATLESPAGLPLGTLTAKGGVVNLTDSRVSLRGAVEITSTTGRQIQTSQVMLDLKSNRLIGDTSYVLRASKTARPTAGTEFVADPGLIRVQTAAEFAREQAAIAQRAAKAAADSAARAARTKAGARKAGTTKAGTSGASTAKAANAANAGAAKTAAPPVRPPR